MPRGGAYKINEPAGAEVRKTTVQARLALTLGLHVKDTESSRDSGILGNLISRRQPLFSGHQSLPPGNHGPVLGNFLSLEDKPEVKT